MKIVWHLGKYQVYQHLYYRVSEGEKRQTKEYKKKKLFKEIMTKNFPNMGKETHIQV